MTNVKIRMTNQIQMIKCQNDSVKKPDYWSGLLLPSTGTAGFFAESSFHSGSQNQLNLGTPYSKPFGRSSSSQARGI